MELLKQIKGFNNNYYISNKGNVYSKKTGRLKIKNTFESHGYKRVKLFCNNKSKNFFGSQINC